MARYKHIDTSPRFLAVNLERQLLPGTFSFRALIPSRKHLLSTASTTTLPMTRESPLMANGKYSYSFAGGFVDDRVWIDSHRVSSAREVKRCAKSRIFSEQVRDAIKLFEEPACNAHTAVLSVERGSIREILRSLRMD